MAITLDAITLPEDLIWTDEFSWQQVKQKKQYTLTGALIIQSGKKLKGRPITLKGDEKSAWITRSTLVALNNKIALMAEMTLTMNDGATYNVIFNAESNPIDAQPIIDFNNPDDADFYSLTLKLMEV